MVRDGVNRQEIFISFNGLIVLQAKQGYEQGWLSPQQKATSPLPWGETGDKNLSVTVSGTNGRKWEDMGRNS